MREKEKLPLQHPIKQLERRYFFSNFPFFPKKNPGKWRAAELSSWPRSFTPNFLVQFYGKRRGGSGLGNVQIRGEERNEECDISKLKAICSLIFFSGKSLDVCRPPFLTDCVYFTCSI